MAHDSPEHSREEDEDGPSLIELLLIIVIVALVALLVFGNERIPAEAEPQAQALPLGG